MWYVYILLCRDKSLYTGITTDLERRFAAHLKGGAKYTRSNPPLQVVYREVVASRSLALKREHEIKSLTRKEKLALIRAKKEDAWARSCLRKRING